MGDSCRVIYCHCAHARIIPEEVKNEVLDGLSASGISWQAVSDLCEMAARKDPVLSELAADGPVKIAACYPRAVKWLLGATLGEEGQKTTQVCNMREDSGETILDLLLNQPHAPNLPEGKGKAPIEIIEESAGDK